MAKTERYLDNETLIMIVFSVTRADTEKKNGIKPRIFASKNQANQFWFHEILILIMLLTQLIIHAILNLKI